MRNPLFGSKFASTHGQETRMMRVCAMLFTLALVAFMAAPTLAATRSKTVDAPEGAYWDTELGVYVLDPPIRMGMYSVPSGDTVILYDGGDMNYLIPQSYEYFPLTRVSKPDCQGENFILTSVLVGCFNYPDGDVPDIGWLNVFEHHYSTTCLYVSPYGDSIGALLGSQVFQGLPYDDWYPDSLPKAQWTVVDFTTPVEISGNEFWVAWDYMTPPGASGFSWYTLGNWRTDPPLDPTDKERFFESFGTECPSRVDPDYESGWMMRFVGHCVPGGGPGEGLIDIKPRSCPNPLNVKSKGVLPVAILGTEELDVVDVDPTTIRMLGVPPIRWAFEDVAEPFPGELCDCWTEGPDGWEDLTIKFETQAIVEALGDVNDRDTLEVAVTWTLYDGTEMSGSDCIIILKKPTPKPRNMDIQTAGVRSATGREFALFQNSPNPVKSRTTIMFSLPESAPTTLIVYDASGSVLEVLLDADMTAGLHAVEWNSDVPAGMYFYRLKSGEHTATKKLIHLR